MTINNIESYNKKELIEVLEIAQEEYTSLAKANAELVERIEKAERELEDCKANVNHLMSDCHRFTDKRLAEFALQQKIEGFKYGFKRVLYMMALEKDSLGKGLDVHIAEESDKYADQLRKQLEI